MIYQLIPDPNAPTHVANRSTITVAESVVYLEFGQLPPGDIARWHQEAQSGRTPPTLQARSVARVVTSLDGLMTLRAQIDDLVRALGLDQTGVPSGTKSRAN